jgi:hypothetical protein
MYRHHLLHFDRELYESERFAMHGVCELTLPAERTPDTCPLCTNIPNCLSAEICTSATDSQCGICAGGYFLVNGIE